MKKLLLIILCLAFSSSAFSQPFEVISGEIINVNYQYNIAFCDIGEQYISVGDIVEVQTKSGNEIFLQVVNVSPVLSKLIPAKSKRYRTNSSDFEEVTIGNVVQKIPGDDEKVNINKPTQKEPKISDQQGFISYQDSSPAEDRRFVRDQSDLLFKHFEELNKNYSELTALFKDVKDMNFGLKNELDQTKRELNVARDRIKNLRIKNRDLGNEIQRLTAQSNSRSSKEGTYQAKINQFQKTIATLKKKLKYLEQLIIQIANSLFQRFFPFL